MNPRELVILLLGLAIVAVVLRGLYVALQARRGQIRLAIDKNIPKDVDLDALEMAELPSGGARVVRRGGGDEQRGDAQQAATAAVTRASARAAELDLGEDSGESVPVLMDAVQVSAEARESQPERILIDDYDSPYSEGDITQGEAQDEEGDDWDDSSEQVAEPQLFGTSEDQDQYEDEDGDYGADAVSTARAVFPDSEPDNDIPESDPDDVLLDYEEEDLAAVAPDYQQTETRNTLASEDSGGWRNGEADFDEDDYDEVDEEAEQDYEDEIYGEDDFEDGEEDSEDDYDEGSDYESEEDYDDEDDFEDDDESRGYADEEDDELEDRAEPALGSFEDDLDDFSMTAGERIGFEGKRKESPKTSARKADRKAPASQAALFEEGDEDEALAGSSGGNKGGKRRSLFAALTGWGKSARRANEADENVETVEQFDEAEAESGTGLSGQQAARKQGPADYTAESTASAFSMEPQQLDIEPAVNEFYEDEQAIGAAASDAQEVNDRAATGEPSEVLVLNVMAKEGYVFAGDDLMHTLITSGLKFGDMNIFHQRLGNQPKGPVIFSVANILNPGTFDLNSMDTFTTVGISLFLALPSPINNLDAFDKMLGLGQQLCAALGGDLRDDSRNLMTAQTIEHYRQRVRDFELRQLKAAGSRG